MSNLRLFYLLKTGKKSLAAQGFDFLRWFFASAMQSKNVAKTHDFRIFQRTKAQTSAAIQAKIPVHIKYSSHAYSNHEKKTRGKPCGFFTNLQPFTTLKKNHFLFGQIRLIPKFQIGSISIQQLELMQKKWSISIENMYKSRNFACY